MAMVESIHGELRKPSTAAEKTRKIAANLRAKIQRHLRSEERKIGANWRQNNFGQFRGWPRKSLNYEVFLRWT